jgi:polyadenylate-binding protein 2
MDNEEKKVELNGEIEEVENVTNEADERDKRSIFIGNVDYSTSTEELRNLFKECGAIERVTIPTDKVSGHPKGYAYLEFVDVSSVTKAESVNDKNFKGRKLKVLPKRNNIPKIKPRSSRPFMRRSYSYSRPRYSRYRPY